MRAFDWAATHLGDPTEWPQSLQSVLSVCLNSPIVSAIYWGPDFRVLYNDAYAPALGKRHPDALGRPLREVWPEIADILVPQLAKVVASGEGFAVDRQPLTMYRHGFAEDTCWFYVFAPVRGEGGSIAGVFVTAVEITRQIEAEKSLRDLNATLEHRVAEVAAERDQLWRLSRDPFVICDTEGRWVSASPVWTEILGWSREELVGRTSEWMEHPDDQRKSRDAVVNVAGGEILIAFRNRFRDKSGNFRSFSWSAVADGNLLYCVARDVTEEMERAAALRNYEELLDSERESSILREQFIAVLGHDLRNPLASISGGLHMLQKEQPPDRRKLVLDLLQASVVRMSVLIDNVLDFARGRLGAGIPLQLRQGIWLGPVLEQVTAELRIGSPEKKIETDFVFSKPVKCDPSRISQLLSNLLANALTYGAPDKPVRVHGDNENGRLTIWIANTGDPIPPAAMERLFQPFFRGEVRESQQGLGLGLHIASEIAKAHGGSLDVTSSEEETRFTFTMPNPD